MKTLKLKNELPIRVKEKDVNSYLKMGYSYCPKSEYKTLVRDGKIENGEKQTKSIKQPTEKKKKYQREKRS